MSGPLLQSARLTLRPPRPEDADPIARYLSDFAVSGNLARVPFPYSKEAAQAWLAGHVEGAAPEETVFSIAVEGAGYAGHIGFRQGADGPVFGYWLGRPYWGKGYMSEAARTCLDWFFAHSQARAVYSGAFHFNAASLAIQAKLGFSEIGRSRLLCLARQAELEHIDTQLMRSVWDARAPQPPRHSRTPG